MSSSDPRPSIPVFEKEIMEAEARRFGGDYDKVSSTSLHSAIWSGVTVSSRYSVADELELMLDMVGELTSSQRAVVDEIFCDSKRGNDFTVTLNAWDADLARAIGQKLGEVALTRSHGHSGILLKASDPPEGGPYIEIESDIGGFDE